MNYEPAELYEQARFLISHGSGLGFVEQVAEIIELKEHYESEEVFENECQN